MIASNACTTAGGKGQNTGVPVWPCTGKVSRSVFRSGCAQFFGLNPIALQCHRIADAKAAVAQQQHQGAQPYPVHFIRILVTGKQNLRTCSAENGSVGGSVIFGSSASFSFASSRLGRAGAWPVQRLQAAVFSFRCAAAAPHRLWLSVPARRESLQARKQLFFRGGFRVRPASSGLTAAHCLARRSAVSVSLPISYLSWPSAVAQFRTSLCPFARPPIRLAAAYAPFHRLFLRLTVFRAPVVFGVTSPAG